VIDDGDDKGEGIGADPHSDTPTLCPRKPGRTRSPIPKDAAREARDERIGLLRAAGSRRGRDEAREKDKDLLKDWSTFQRDLSTHLSTYNSRPMKEEPLDALVEANDLLYARSAAAEKEDNDGAFYDAHTGRYQALPVHTVPDSDVEHEPTEENQGNIDACLEGRATWTQAMEGQSEQNAHAWADSVEEQARFEAETQSAGLITVSQEERENFLIGRSSSSDKPEL